MCFLHTLLYFLLLLGFMFNNIQQNRTWRLRQKRERNIGQDPSSKLQVGAPGWIEIDLEWGRSCGNNT